jgi:hypothetical protein
LQTPIADPLQNRRAAHAADFVGISRGQQAVGPIARADGCRAIAEDATINASEAAVNCCFSAVFAWFADFIR